MLAHLWQMSQWHLQASKTQSSSTSSTKSDTCLSTTSNAAQPASGSLQACKQLKKSCNSTTVGNVVKLNHIQLLSCMVPAAASVYRCCHTD